MNEIQRPRHHPHVDSLLGGTALDVADVALLGDHEALTTIAKQAGTSVAMIDKHYAGVIANWDGRPVPAEVQIGTGGRSVDVRDRERV